MQNPPEAVSTACQPARQVRTFKKAIETAIAIVANLADSWRSSDLVEKLRLQALIFPDGIGYGREKDRVRTFRVNSLFAQIPHLAALSAKK